MARLALGWFAALLLGTTGTAQAQPGDPVVGRALALELCSTCHLVPGSLRPVPDGVPSFTAIARSWTDPQALADRMIVPPHPAMPPPPLTNQQRRDLAAWILSLRE